MPYIHILYSIVFSIHGFLSARRNKKNSNSITTIQLIGNFIWNGILFALFLQLFRARVEIGLSLTLIILSPILFSIAGIFIPFIGRNKKGARHCYNSLNGYNERVCFLNKFGIKDIFMGVPNNWEDMHFAYKEVILSESRGVNFKQLLLSINSGIKEPNEIKAVLAQKPVVRKKAAHFNVKSMKEKGKFYFMSINKRLRRSAFFYGIGLLIVVLIMILTNPSYKDFKDFTSTEELPNTKVILQRTHNWLIASEYQQTIYFYSNARMYKYGSYHKVQSVKYRGFLLNFTRTYSRTDKGLEGD